MSTNKETISFLISMQRFENEISLMNYVEELRISANMLNFDSEFVLITHHSPINISVENKFILAQYKTQIVSVGPRTSWISGIFLGLTRSNGDFCFIPGASVNNLSRLLSLMMTEIIRSKTDLIGCTQKKQKIRFNRALRMRFIFAFIRRRSQIPLYVEICEDLLVTRRALNWIIRDRSVSTSLLEILFIPGITVSLLKDIDFAKKLDISKNTLSLLVLKYTSFPRLFFNFIFYLTSLITISLILNIFSVYFFEYNLLGQQTTDVPRWTNPLIITLIGFSIQTYFLSIIFRAIMFLSEETSTKPKTTTMSAIRL